MNSKGKLQMFAKKPSGELIWNRKGKAKVQSVAQVELLLPEPSSVS